MYSQDSLINLKISDTFYINNNGQKDLNDLEFPFFDSDKNKIFVSFSIDKKLFNDSLDMLLLEVKKNSLQQNRIKPFIKKIISIEGNKVYFDSIDISENLVSGNYDVLVSVINDQQQKKLLNKKSFQTIRNFKGVLKNEFEEQKPLEDIDLNKTFVGKYSVEQMDKNIKSLVPIAEMGELRVISTIKKGDSNAKQFFYNFWYNRNNSEPEKEWKSYAEKLNFIAKKYASTGLAGYETDRGKIYLIYGEPHTVEIRDNEKGALPYEVWFYYEAKDKKNVKFLFYQPGNLSDQKIILHSTEPDILVNPYWKNVLLKDPTNNDNKLMYRVFEYFK